MDSVVLVVTHSSDVTADYLCGRMAEASVPHLRFNSDADLSQVSVEYACGKASLMVEGRTITPEDVGHVWFRRPEELLCPVACDDDAEQKHVVEEWSAALEGFFAHIPLGKWVNHPSRNAAASHKIEQLTRAVNLGLATPETLLTRDLRTLQGFWDACDGEVVAKPLISGYLERIEPSADTLIYTNRVERHHLEQADMVLPSCPTLFQRLVRKSVDVRVAVVDQAFFPIGMQAGDGATQRLDIRRNNMDDVRYVQVGLPTQVRSQLRQLLDSYGLRFAAIDMAVDLTGNWIFFEINPNGQWAWTDLEGATDIASGFIRAFRREKVNNG